jgi:hypothetical protein
LETRAIINRGNSVEEKLGNSFITKEKNRGRESERGQEKVARSSIRPSTA